MGSNDIPGLTEFLRDYPQMAIRPAATGLLLRGQFAFTASAAPHKPITDSYSLKIEVPPEFPRALPKVTELANKIPRNGFFHVNGHDDSLCLGSPLRLLLNVSKNPTLVGFAETCLVPYLYAISHKLQFGGPFIFKELAHGRPGIHADCVDLLGLKTQSQAACALRMLAMKRRRANKLPCPCGCGKRLGRCRLHHQLNGLRKLTSRAWFRSQLN